MTNKERTSQEASERSNDPYEEKLTRKYIDSLKKNDDVSKEIKTYNYQKELQEYFNAKRGADKFEEKQYAFGGLVSRQVSGFGKARKK